MKKEKKVFFAFLLLLLLFVLDRERSGSGTGGEGRGTLIGVCPVGFMQEEEGKKANFLHVPSSSMCRVVV